MQHSTTQTTNRQPTEPQEPTEPTPPQTEEARPGPEVEPEDCQEGEPGGDEDAEDNYLEVWACGPGKKRVLCHSITWPKGEPMPRRNAT